jgi:hypothetical protein
VRDLGRVGSAEDFHGRSRGAVLIRALAREPDRYALP